MSNSVRFYLLPWWVKLCFVLSPCPCLARVITCKREICDPTQVSRWILPPPFILRLSDLAIRATCAPSAPSARLAASARWVWRSITMTEHAFDFVEWFLRSSYCVWLLCRLDVAFFFFFFLSLDVRSTPLSCSLKCEEPNKKWGESKRQKLGRMRQSYPKALQDSEKKADQRVAFIVNKGT